MASSIYASAETRTLKLYNTHTREKAEITFKKNGRYVRSGLKELNQFLRDWRRNEPTKMDPELFDVVWEVYQKAKTKEYIHVVSSYRSPKTNNMLRSRSSGVAKNSQHTKGKAMDFFIPGVNTRRLRDYGLHQHVGGVGFYPRSNTPFVHLDTGTVRHWPRMSRSELAKVFPRGDTIHVPSDGRRMARYGETLAEINRKGNTSDTSIRTARRSSDNSGTKHQRVSPNSGDKDNKGTFFERLFSNSGEKDSAKTTTRRRQEDPGRRVEADKPVSVTPKAKVVLASAEAPAQPQAQTPAAATPIVLPPSTQQVAATTPAPAQLAPEAVEVEAVANAPVQLAAAVPYAKPGSERTVVAEEPAAQEEVAPTLLASIAQPRTKPTQIAALSAYNADPSILRAPRKPLDAIGAIDLVTNDQGTGANAEAPVVLASADPRQSMAALQTASTGSAEPAKAQAQTQTRSNLDPMAHFTARPGANTTLLLSGDQVERDWNLAHLYHPNQVDLGEVTTAVNTIVANGFNTSTNQIPTSGAFSGNAVTWLKTTSTY
ncbi:DUF882 domain-containing protein [Rhodobacteraceae bacterium RKSG542]|nr:DUF882 domain-containing protein [Pseudovibrio flavus]